MRKSGRITWRSPSNIAMVKYWGKKGFQLPVNPSISMTLSKCYTETVIEYIQKTNPSGPTFDFLFQGEKHQGFEERVSQFLNIAAAKLPALNYLHLKIETFNSFPHSAGIASSASSLSSIALCLNQIDQKLSGKIDDRDNFFRKTSFLARSGSGSACRSIYGGWVLWGETSVVASSSDEYAIPVNDLVHKQFYDYYDSILIVNAGEKVVKSSLGHKLMDSNPYKEVRIQTGKMNASNFINALKNGDDKIFRNIIEYEAANLHAMFLTSTPKFVLVKPETLHIINILNQFRAESGLGYCFTLDAGPNIHLLYPADIRDKMLPFIKSELTPFCENNMWIDDKMGIGPELINS